MSLSGQERKIYSAREKILLTNLVEQYKDIIECKKTDSVNLHRKQEVWARICTAYNTNDVSKRTPKQLKKLWDNLKQKTRKSDTQRKNEILKTGGGPPPDDKPSPLFDKIRSIVPGIDLEIENCWDSIGSFRDQSVESMQANDPEKGDQQTAKSSIFSIDHDYSELKDERVGNAVIQTSSKSSTVSNHHCFEDTQEKEEINLYNDKENISCLSRKRKLPIKQPFKHSKGFIEEEASLRIEKIKESIEQQRELHNLKLETARAEKEYWRTKVDYLKNNASC